MHSSGLKPQELSAPAWSRFDRWLTELDKSVMAVPLFEKSDKHATLVVSGSPNRGAPESGLSDLRGGNRIVMGLAAKLPLRGSPTGTRSLGFWQVQ